MVNFMNVSGDQYVCTYSMYPSKHGTLVIE